MSYLDPFEEEEDYNPSSNYLVRHWKGQNSLPFAYWINGSIITFGLAFAISAIQAQVQGSSASLRIMAITGLALIALSLLAWVWSSVGIWRSATRHPYRGGSGGWAAVAKAIIVLGCLGMLARTPSLYLTTRELGQLAAGTDPLGKNASITVRPDGSLQVDGFLTQGFADRFAAALKANPGAQVLVLNSPGGRVVEGERFAQQVKAAGLDTLVEDECSSACIFPFLAGKRRLLGADSRLGFHQPSFPGASAAENRENTAAFRDSMIKAGVSPSFSAQAVTAAPDDMWYPDLPRLVDAKVVTGLDRSAVIKDNQVSAASVSKEVPQRLDAYTVLTAARASGMTLEFDHKVSLSAAQIDPVAAKREINKNVCAKREVAMMMEAGAVYRYVFRDSDGDVVAEFEITGCS